MKSFKIYYLDVTGKRVFVAAMGGKVEANTKLEELERDYPELKFLMEWG